MAHSRFYLDYLKSEAWKEKRTRKLALSNHRCSSCSSKKKLEVHHLTYERLGNERMEDLMLLCQSCHSLVEKLIRAGDLPRKGNPVLLAQDTLTLLGSGFRKPRKKKLRRSQKSANRRAEKIVKTGSKRHPHDIQMDLVTTPYIAQAVKIMRRSEFLKAIKLHYGNNPKIISNALVVYDRYTTTKDMLTDEIRARFTPF